MSDPGGRAARLGRTPLHSAPSEIPPGSALVHNDVKPDSPTFAIWLQWWPRPRDGLERCECGWRWDLGDHYRVRHLMTVSQVHRLWADLPE
jgi:hypothetical protein